MNCFYHQNKEAGGQCPNCGKYLCRECHSIMTNHFCIDCTSNSYAQAKGAGIRGLITCAVMIIIGVLIGIYLLGGWMDNVWIGILLGISLVGTLVNLILSSQNDSMSTAVFKANNPGTNLVVNIILLVVFSIIMAGVVFIVIRLIRSIQLTLKNINPIVEHFNSIQ